MKKYAVSRKIRDELSEQSDMETKAVFIPSILDEIAKTWARKVDEEIYDALRTKIEFTITWLDDNLVSLKITNPLDNFTDEFISSR